MKLKHYYVAGILAAACLEFVLVQIRSAFFSGGDDNLDASDSRHRPLRRGGSKSGHTGLDKKKGRKPNERRIPVQQLKVPTPIIVLSLPKSGTSSLYQYFNCGGTLAAHTFAFDPVTKKEYRLGTRFRKNFKHNLPLLTNTGKLQVFTDIGEVNGLNSCFYPSIDALDSIARDYPNATLIVSYRPGWYQSITKFQLLGKRWKKWCPSFPNTTTDEAEWEAFYQTHRQRIRATVQEHPSLHYLEFDLTDPTAGQQLQDFTGIDQACWGDCKPNMKCSYHGKEEDNDEAKG